MVTFDLTLRQAARVLEQAVRSQANLLIEPRVGCETPFRGTIAGRDANLLQIELHDTGVDFPLVGLIGAFCDVQTVLSGQLYLFSTCVIDVADDAIPQRIQLATPTSIQLVNRRKFERHFVPGTAPIRLRADGSVEEPPVGELIDFSADGLACRVSRAATEDILLVGDAVRVRFELPGNGGSFDLPATVCNKTPARGEDQILVGLEFNETDDDPATREALLRLRRVAFDVVTGSPERERDV